ncbi:uncharacterized protein G2W53_015547 [Senna tora]|uniref:Transmembrane protein n=1 Tax=Senna tora TaxID=362788 RepID=A0A834WVI0_9FABA|nr:uncharacterized protein G2W53_015547 [Senna tora]
MYNPKRPSPTHTTTWSVQFLSILKRVTTDNRAVMDGANSHASLLHFLHYYYFLFTATMSLALSLILVQHLGDINAPLLSSDTKTMVTGQVQVEAKDGLKASERDLFEGSTKGQEKRLSRRRRSKWWFIRQPSAMTSMKNPAIGIARADTTKAGSNSSLGNWNRSLKLEKVVYQSKKRKLERKREGNDGVDRV